MLECRILAGSNSGESTIYPNIPSLKGALRDLEAKNYQEPDKQLGAPNEPSGP